MAAVPPKSGAAGGFAGYQKFWHDKRILGLQGIEWVISGDS
jgi:hypothetical protein